MKDSLGDRMKAYYEDRSRVRLIRRVPVIIRVDGNAFHSLTRKGFDKPFDVNLMSWMVAAATRLAEELPGFKVGYVQSDEASFFINDFDSLDTEAWFDYVVQKVASLSAAKMTGYFKASVDASPIGVSKMAGRIAVFDGRCWNHPMEEVANYFLWRAQDWARNSLSMLTRAHYSHRQVHGKHGNDMHEMLHAKGVNWARQHPRIKNGTFLYRAKNEKGRLRVVEDCDVTPKFKAIDAVVQAAMELGVRTKAERARVKAEGDEQQQT
jgi:tRNA(His) 5'-end guanylyltransferase